MSPIEPRDGGCRVHLLVAPRANRTRVVGVHGDRVKLQVAAPPVDGKANRAIERWLAKTLGVRRDAIRWVSGETGKRKTLEVSGVSAARARAALGL